MDNKHFSVSWYSARPRTPWKVEVKASFAGRKVRRFFESEGEAWSEGAKLVEAIRERGLSGLDDPGPGGMSMQAATEAWEKRFVGKSKSHREKAAKVAGDLREAFATVAVAPADLDRWFARVPGTENTRAVVWRYVRGFFRWARRMEFLERDPGGVLDAPVTSPRRNILMAAQMRDLLAAEMPEWLRWAIVFGGFAGLRTEEIFRLQWEDIDPVAGEIFISADVSVRKTEDSIAERIVDFTEPITRRAAGMQGKAGPVVPVYRRKLDSERRAVAAALGWPKWPENALRHSFATYHLARCKDPGKTAHQMGHSSPAMVRRVYAVPARRAHAEEWWSL